MSFEDRKIAIDTQQQSNLVITKFAYESLDGVMTTVKKDDWNGYATLSENGARLFFQHDGYAFLQSIDSNEHRHYWVGLSYWNREHPDTFFELDLDTFFDFINMYLNENLSQFYEELKIIEFGGQLLDHFNQKNLVTN